MFIKTQGLQWIKAQHDKQHAFSHLWAWSIDANLSNETIIEYSNESFHVNFDFPPDERTRFRASIAVLSLLYGNFPSMIDKWCSTNNPLSPSPSFIVSGWAFPFGGMQKRQLWLFHWKIGQQSSNTHFPWRKHMFGHNSLIICKDLVVMMICRYDIDILRGQYCVHNAYNYNNSKHWRKIK